jgi:hypothetical protein
MNTARLSAIILRALFIVFLGVHAVQSHWGTVRFYGVIFLIMLPLLWLARNDNRYYWLDTAVSALFTVPLAASVWINIFEDTLTGIDKLFHAIGGALLAVFVAFALSKHIKTRWVYALAIIAFALSLGVLWEWYECLSFALAGDLQRPLLYADTMLDLVADTIGACVVAIIVWFKK